MYVCALPETPLRRARYECIARLGYSFYKMTAPRRAVFFVRRVRLWFVKGQSLNENGKSVLPKTRIKRLSFVIFGITQGQPFSIIDYNFGERRLLPLDVEREFHVAPTDFTG